MPANPATNSRFKPMGDGAYSEMIATTAMVFYNPADGSVRMHFHGRAFLPVGAKQVPLSATSDVLELELDPGMSRCYGPADGSLLDPVTGADLGKVSNAGVMLLFKIAYDAEHNARAAAVAAKIAAAEVLAV